MENKPQTPPAPETSLSSKPVEATVPATPAPARHFGRLFSFANKYFFIYVTLLLIVGILAINQLGSGGKPASSTSGTSLTSQQLSSLKGSTTLVGNSQQTLDVQSASIFEDQVLLRKDLGVAGSIKAGGSLSVPSLTIGGSATLGQAQVNGTLAVVGTTTLQGFVNLQKNLTVAGSGSFGSLSTSQLNTSSLQLTGDLNLAHHLVTTGSAPAKSNGSSLGSGGTANLSGSDTAGTITINTGGSPVAGCFVTVNFAQKFADTPHVVISPSNSNAGAIDYYTNRSAASFSVCDAGNPASGTTYTFDYFVAG